MLGRTVVEELRGRGIEPVPTNRATLDVADPAAVESLVAGGFGPIDAVVNCAAYTAVDRAESEEEEATRINGVAVELLGRVCADLRVPLIHVSTDFVFDGTSPEPYAEDAPTNPLSAYGRGKRRGEQALEGNPYARIVRTAWLFAPQGRCFPRTMVEAHKAGRNLRVVADQRGNPTYVPDLARTLVDLLEREAPAGIYHAVGPDRTTWHDFAIRAIRAVTGVAPSVEPVATEAFPTPAVRPKNSSLADGKLSGLGIAPMRPLDAALEDWARLAFPGTLPHSS